MKEKYIVKTVSGSTPHKAQELMNEMDKQGYRVLAVSHGHVCGSICFIITFERKE